MLIRRDTRPATGRIWRCAALIALGFLAGCAPRTYEPAPLSTGEILGGLESRSITAPKVQEFLAESGADTTDWPPSRWTLGMLALVAAYYHPELKVARAEQAVFEAAEITARRRLNPGIEPVIEHHSEPGAQSTPWSVGFALQIPIETSDKRSARIAIAEANTDAARFRVGQTAWQVRRTIRERFVDLFAAEARAVQVGRELEVRGRMLGLLERRLALGETDAVTVGSARLLQQQAQTELNATSRDIAVARTALATALSLPAEAVVELTIGTDALSRWTAPAFSGDAIQRNALLNRLDVREALARYAAAEARLRLEVARQYPDVTLSPGFLWDQGDLVWSVGAAILAPLLDLNQGPIAEAEAARQLEAARFIALQSRVLGALDIAQAAHVAAGNALNNAQSFWFAQDTHRNRMNQQFAAGEASRLGVLEAELALITAERAVLDERVNALRAFGLLEDAVQQPLDEATLFGDLSVAAEQN